MHFMVTMQTSINPYAGTAINGLPAFVQAASFTFVIEAPDFESAFELSADLAELCPYATTVEVKQLDTSPEDPTGGATR